MEVLKNWFPELFCFLLKYPNIEKLLTTVSVIIIIIIIVIAVIVSIIITVTIISAAGILGFFSFSLAISTFLDDRYSAVLRVRR